MSSTYNRGEWAELYVLAKIICEQSVTVRVHGSTVANNSLDVRRVRRGSKDDAEEFLVDGDHIVCVHLGKRIPKGEVCRHVKPLLRAVKAGEGKSFSLTVGDDLLALLGINQLKTSGREKSDIHLDVRDPLTGVTGAQGYIVKALIGSKPTLFNASEPTNFEYRITPQVPEHLVTHYNTTDSKGKLIYGTRKMVSELMSEGHTFTLVGIDKRFRENLELLDTDMARFLDELILAYYGYRAGRATSVTKLLESLQQSNPLGLSNPKVRYQHKIKDFLEASAYGMVPTEPYIGKHTVEGGLLLVERSGHLSCFRLDDRDQTRDYLVAHTFLDTSSREKHKFGVLENRGDKTFVKLNLQVRYR